MKIHAAAKTVTARVKTNPDSLSQFSNWICDKSFVNKLKTAREHPEDQASKELLALITKHIALFENKIPFTTTTYINVSPPGNDHLPGISQ